MQEEKSDKTFGQMLCFRVNRENKQPSLCVEIISKYLPKILTKENYK